MSNNALIILAQLVSIFVIALAYYDGLVGSYAAGMLVGMVSLIAMGMQEGHDGG